MIDIHSHIIPGIDDGSDSMETTLKMLRTAAESGVSTVVATPHFDRNTGYENYASDELEARFAEVERAAKEEGLPLELVRGMEIFASHDVPDLLDEGRLWTLGGTGSILIEFGFREDPEFCGEVLKRCLRHGFDPVIAHPERYKFVQRRPQTAYEWVRMGCSLQINKGSILGRFGEETRLMGMRLISHGLAAFVASDAHGADRRTTRMREVKELLAAEFGEEHAALLLTRNPARLLAGRGLLGYEPYPFI